MKGSESMKTTMTETKFLIYTVSAIILLMLVRIFLPELNTIYDPNNYVGIHTVLEVVCIAISVTIFLYGLKSYRSSRSSRMLFLALTFLIVGMVDLLHMISYKGMPFFITESSVAKATWFWVIARVIQSLLMLFLLLLLPDRKLKKNYWFLSLLTGFFLGGGIGVLVIFFEGSLPLLVIEGRGTTVLKNSIEYFVSLILFVSLIITLYHYYLEKSEEKLYFALAMVFLLFTELIFTIYQSVFDLDNFLGHVFKVFGFYFILKSFYFSKVATVEGEKEMTLLEQPGIFFTLKKQGTEFICLDIKGELLQTIGFHQDEIIGRLLTDVLLPIKSPINDYCYLAQELKETVTFEVVCMEKSLLISIKTSFNEENQNVILGTVIDMTGVLQQKLSHKPMKSEDNNVRVVM
jgi:hypothetical protein